MNVLNWMIHNIFDLIGLKTYLSVPTLPKANRNVPKYVKKNYWVLIKLSIASIERAPL